ncbi:MAG: hypothetical protein BWX51_01086 [Bacteroidetes bacterium ADurb.Bin012]|nr:MAG: hypothetical protein BWX51_01086 [Bacteroidetes bacterium ADurb.Bin012]
MDFETEVTNSDRLIVQVPYHNSGMMIYLET